MGGERQGGLLKSFSCPSTPHLAACRNFWRVLLLPWLKDKWHQSPADNQESFRKRQDTWNRMSQSGLTHSARPLRELSLTSLSDYLSVKSLASFPEERNRGQWNRNLSLRLAFNLLHLQEVVAEMSLPRIQCPPCENSGVRSFLVTGNIVSP